MENTLLRQKIYKAFKDLTSVLLICDYGIVGAIVNVHLRIKTYIVGPLKGPLI